MVRPLRVWPMIELELRGKYERVPRDERKPTIPNFKVLGHWLTFQVRSMTEKSGKSGPVRTSLIVAAIGFFGVLIMNSYHVSFDHR